MSAEKKQRVDKFLAEHFPQFNRSQIQKLIEQKLVYYSNNGQWEVVKKPGQIVSEEEQNLENWKIEPSPWTQYVSRAGIKLAGALDHWQVSVEGLVALDVGLSTGGFTECLLQRGAIKILGIDVGRNQLHEKLKADPRLTAQDQVNARDPLPHDLLMNFFADDNSPQQFDLVTIDVSFISLEKIIPNLLQYLKPGGLLIALVKPQFELGRQALNKQGIVKADTDPFAAVEKNMRIFTTQNLESLAYCGSPIEGDDGNKEFFIHAKMPIR